MIAAPTEPTLIQAYLADGVIKETNPLLLAAVSWLDNTYGRAQKKIRVIEGKVYSFPAVYIGGKEYFATVPGKGAGAFSFWDIQEPYRVIDSELGKRNLNQAQMKVEAGLVVFMNLSVAYPTETGRSIDYAKAQVWKALMRTTPSAGGFIPYEIVESWDRVFQGYSLTEAESEFLSYPNAAFRVNGTLTFKTLC